MTDLLDDVAGLRARVAAWKAAGQSVGVVPTMGALHEGHLSLARAARAGADRVVVTVFVNPRQFDRPDDLARYPRRLDSDAALLAPLGIDAIFAPAPQAVYPPGFATTVSVAGPTGDLEGASRPGHFDGMATVVAKLFGMTGADRAWFGEKDWQQLQVIRRLVADLDLAVAVVPVATVRDADGLALSSRNARLSPQGRAAAPALYRALAQAAREIAEGAAPGPALAAARAGVLSAGFERIDYLDLRGAETLAPQQRFERPARLLAAAWLNGLRLIDNIAV